MLYGFQSLLNIITIILAVLSCCRIKSKVVNDAKSTMAIIYINSVNAFLALLLSVAFTNKPSLKALVGSFGVAGFPTTILLLVFIPKVKTLLL